MREIDVSKITELFAANDNGSDVYVSLQPELTPEMQGKKVGFGFDSAINRVVKSLPFEKEMLTGLLIDNNRLKFHGIRTPEPEELMQRMEDSIYDTNFLRLKGEFPVFEMTPGLDDVDPLQYLSDADRDDFELMEKGSNFGNDPSPY